MFRLQRVAPYAPQRQDSSPGRSVNEAAHPPGARESAHCP